MLTIVHTVNPQRARPIRMGRAFCVYVTLKLLDLLHFQYQVKKRIHHSVRTTILS